MAVQWESQGKTFVITGGASGLGARYVETFLEQGAKFVAVLDVAEEVGKAFAARLNNTYPGKVVFIKCDVSNEGDIESAFNQVLVQCKQIDVLINNAGIMVDSPSTWRVACDVNWQGLISFTLRAIKHMRKDEDGAGGTIINISSTAALTKFPFLPIYNGSKMAVLHFSQCLAMDPFFENTGIRVLTMCFGPTDTPLLHGLEKRTYDIKLGQKFVELIEVVMESGKEYQKVDSAVAAFVHMFKNGPPGSIWLSVDDRPVQNITSLIDKVFKDIEVAIYPSNE